MFKMNHEEAFEGYSEIKDGEYEVIITQAMENSTPGGAEFLDIRLQIRNDIEQPSQNAYIFYKIWKSKEKNVYSSVMINTLGKNCRMQNGKEYKKMQDLLDDFVYKTLRVKVKNEETEYNGATYTNLNVKKLEETKFAKCNHKLKSENHAESIAQEIEDDDLPF